MFAIFKVKIDLFLVEKQWLLSSKVSCFFNFLAFILRVQFTMSHFFETPLLLFSMLNSMLFFDKPLLLFSNISSAFLWETMFFYFRSAIQWQTIFKIIASWFISPLLSGIMAISLYFLVSKLILQNSTEVRVERAFIFLPVFYSVVCGINVFSILHTMNKSKYLDSVMYWSADPRSTIRI